MHTTTEINCSNLLQVRVNPPDCVNVSTIFQATPDLGFAHITGFALLPEIKNMIPYLQIK